MSNCEYPYAVAKRRSSRSLCVTGKTHSLSLSLSLEPLSPPSSKVRDVRSRREASSANEGRFSGKHTTRSFVHTYIGVRGHPSVDSGNWDEIRPLLFKDFSPVLTGFMFRPVLRGFLAGTPIKLEIDRMNS